MTKAEQTAQMIIEKSAPIFNKLGYSGTSLKDITEATGLTKGAIYGNFLNKEQLAIQAFNYNVRQVMEALSDYVNQAENGLDKLYAITDYYRNYYDFTIKFGGCPILNVGVDTVHQNPELLERVKIVIEKLQVKVAGFIKEGQNEGLIDKDKDETKYAKRIFACIEGSIFMSVMMSNRSYMIDVMNQIDSMIKTDLVN